MTTQHILAVFTDIGRPSNNSQLTNWLTTSGTHKTYWIGLIRSWWKTTDECTYRSDRLLCEQCADYFDTIQSV